MSVTININGNVNNLIVNTASGSSIYANGDEVWSASKPYLTFSSASEFTLDSLPVASGDPVPWDGTMYVSTDADTWSTWDGTTVTSVADGGTHYIYLRGSGNTVISGAQGKGLVLTGTNATPDIRCDGDIRTLLDYSDPENTAMGAKCFMYLFEANQDLIKSPALPATTLSVQCYMGMFSYCTNLLSAPKLPATTAAIGCYANMFYGCASLSAIPSLPATELFATCYTNMFNGCSLVKFSESQTGEYQTAFRIPSEGTGTATGVTHTSNMFLNTGGTFTGNPTINTTYYTANQIVG